MHTIPLLLYLAAGLAYGAHFARRNVAMGRAASTLLAVIAARVGRVRVPGIYFGGGTPSLLPAELISLGCG